MSHITYYMCIIMGSLCEKIALYIIDICMIYLINNIRIAVDEQFRIYYSHPTVAELFSFNYLSVINIDLTVDEEFCYIFMYLYSIT